MSKMIKLMNKMSNQKMTDRYQEKLSKPSTNKIESHQEPEATELHRPQEPHIHPINVQQGPSKLFYTATIGLISMVLLVASMSLIMSVHVIQKINLSQTLLMELAKQSEPQAEKLAFLTKAVETIKETDKKEMKEILSLVNQVGNNVTDQNKDIAQLVKEQRLVKSATEELKTADRLLLNKFISLNDEVNELKKQLSMTQTVINTPDVGRN